MVYKHGAEPSRRVVVAALVERNGRILVARRRPSSSTRGVSPESLWEFPGGKVEAGESLSEALQREIREELGVACTVSSEIPVGSASWDYESGPISLVVLRAALPDAPIDTLDHEEIRWVTLQELDRLEMLPADRSIVSTLLEQGSASTAPGSSATRQDK